MHGDIVFTLRQGLVTGIVSLCIRSTSHCMTEHPLAVPFRDSWWEEDFPTNLRVVGVASDGLEAVLKAQMLQPDLILLDIGPPKVGWD